MEVAVDMLQLLWQTFLNMKDVGAGGALSVHLLPLHLSLQHKWHMEEGKLQRNPNKNL